MLVQGDLWHAVVPALQRPPGCTEKLHGELSPPPHLAVRAHYGQQPVHVEGRVALHALGMLTLGAASLFRQLNTSSVRPHRVFFSLSNVCA